jgi:hypothetical protein
LSEVFYVLNFSFPPCPREVIVVNVSTVPEIAAAIESLPESERQRLESWLIAQRFGDDAALERALTEAIRDADSSPEAGKSPDEVRALIRQWTSESASKSAP